LATSCSNGRALRSAQATSWKRAGVPPTHAQSDRFLPCSSVTARRRPSESPLSRSVTVVFASVMSTVFVSPGL
jgi:hypothetical protein